MFPVIFALGGQTATAEIARAIQACGVQHSNWICLTCDRDRPSIKCDRLYRFFLQNTTRSPKLSFAYAAISSNKSLCVYALPNKLEQSHNLREWFHNLWEWFHNLWEWFHNLWEWFHNL
ncbi:MAG: hypothetical protein RM347_005520, partial [Nostoc sp. ChiQUE02]